MGSNARDIHSNAGMAAFSLKKDGRPAKSKALAFHVHLQEVFENHPEPFSTERIKISFDVLDAITREVTGFSSVLAMVKKELQKAVYSPGLTSNSYGALYESIPFCLMIDRMQKIRSKEVSDSSKEIEHLKQKIKFRDEDLDVLHRKNIQLKQNLLDLQNSYRKAQEEISGVSSEKESLLSEKSALKAQYSQMEERYQKELTELQAVNRQATAALEKITIFQDPIYDNQNKLTEQTGMKRAEIKVTESGILKYDMQQCDQITKQFSEMLDHLLDEFEGNLSQIYRRKEIKYGSAFENPEVISNFTRSIEELIQSNKPRLDTYLLEVENLNKHSQVLKLQEKRNETNKKLPSIDPVDLTARKYAVILQTSEDGEQFYTHEKSVYCTKCGDRVISCPHVPLYSNPIPLSSKVAFLKLSRPILKLRSQNQPIQEEKTEDEELSISPLFFTIWKNFYDKRGGFKPITKRILHQNKVLTIIQELYETKWRWDEASTKDEYAESLQDSLYCFLKERYFHKEIYLKVAHDLFTSLQKIGTTNDHISLFIFQLTGEQEEYWKYMQLIRKLVFSEPSNEVLDKKKYRIKIKSIYPDRESHTYDQVELEYCAFCKNRLSNDSMYDQVAHMIRRKTEPNFQLVAKMADQYDHQQSGYLSFHDFSEICLKLVPTASAIEIEKRYKLAEKFYGQDKVKLDRIIAMGAYIILYTGFTSGWLNSGIIATRFV